MIIVCQRFLKNTKISGITLFPFIILRSPEYRKNKILLNHEKIHLQQQLELLVIFFYLWYVIEYYYLYFKLKNSYLAYKSISFEREAYAMENDLNYLEKRKIWSFWKYILWVFLGAHFRLPFPLFYSAPLHKKSSTQVGAQVLPRKANVF